MAATAKQKSDSKGKGAKDKAPKVKGRAAGVKLEGKKEGKKRDRRMNAKNADRYELYQRAVNSPDADVDFIEKAFRHYRDRDPVHFREDFCGTSAMCAEWLRRDPSRSAEGFDLDPEPIAWGKTHNFNAVPDGTERMEWHEADVREEGTRKPCITAAQNFSYWHFKTRKELLNYFATVRQNLADDGVFVMDLYGGPEATIEQEEVRELGGGIEYVWDQKEYHPATGAYFTAIHFRFRDGSELTNAFEYEWRFWTINEIRDVLLDAGFSDVSAWFEGTDPDDEDEGDGNFEIDPVGENCQAWIAYLAAAK